MKNTGTYTNLEGKEVEFNYVNEISLSQKVNFIMEHAGMGCVRGYWICFGAEETAF